MSCSPVPGSSSAPWARPLTAAVAACCLAVVVAAQAPTAERPEADAPAATSGQDPRPADRTFRTVIADAKALDVKTVQGDITVRRDAAVEGVEITAVVRRTSGTGANRLDDDAFAACLRGAKLVAEKDDQGKVTAFVEFPPASAAGEAAARRHEERCNNSFEVAFTVRAAALGGLAANSVTGSLRAEGNLGPVALATVSGDVRVRDAVGSASATTVSGDVEVRGASGPVAASAVSGDVRIDLAEGATGNVSGTTTTGAVELRLSAAWQGTWQASATLGSVTTGGRTGRPNRMRANEGFGMEAKGVIGDAGAAQAKLTTVTGSIRVVGAAAGSDEGQAQPGGEPTPPTPPMPPRREGGKVEHPTRDDVTPGDDGASDWSGGIQAEVEAVLREAADAASAAAEQARAAVESMRDAFGEHGAHWLRSRGHGEAPDAAAIVAAVRGAMDTTREALAATRAAIAEARAAAEAAVAEFAAARSESERDDRFVRDDASVWLATQDAVRAAIRCLGGALRGTDDVGTAATRTVRITFDSGESRTIRLDGDGSVRVELEERGADGEATKQVYEAPNLEAFVRQHPGVLDGSVETADPKAKQVKVRAPRRSR